MSKSTTGLDRKEWEKAAEKAKEAAASVAEMASHAVSAGGAMATHGFGDEGLIARQAVRDVGKMAEEMAANAGIGIQEMGDRLNQNSPESGILRGASQAVAGAANDGGEYLQSAKLSGMVEDFAHVIRRNPLPSVLIAIGVGWFLGRKTRG
jgi:hypothetical protein